MIHWQLWFALDVCCFTKMVNTVLRTAIVYRSISRYGYCVLYLCGVYCDTLVHQCIVPAIVAIGPVVTQVCSPIADWNLMFSEVFCNAPFVMCLALLNAMSSIPMLLPSNCISSVNNIVHATQLHNNILYDWQENTLFSSFINYHLTILNVLDYHMSFTGIALCF